MHTHRTSQNVFIQNVSSQLVVDMREIKMKMNPPPWQHVQPTNSTIVVVVFVVISIAIVESIRSSFVAVVVALFRWFIIEFLWWQPLH